MSSSPHPALPVIVNRSGGTAGKLGDRLGPELAEAFAPNDVEAKIELVEGKDLKGRVEAARGAPVVAVGGGDGSQSSAAAVLAGSDTALAVLPLGTLNHLAKQLGIPAELPAAAAVAAGGHPKRIDLAKVGETVFVNNASIGLYTRLVRLRERSRLPKWLATVPAAWAVLRRMRLLPFRLDWGKGERSIKTPLLFVGNNRYLLEGLGIGERESMTDGLLAVYAVSAKSPWALASFAARVLIGRADPYRDFAALGESERLTVQGSGAIDVAHDGEVTRMKLPLTFEIMPGALKVMVPSDTTER